jgi:hypothetical protein
MRILPYLIGAVVLVLVSAAACMSTTTSAPSSAPATTTPAELGMPASTAPALAQLPAGITGFYAPDGERAGALPQGAGYQIIGRYGAGWLLLRLPAHGEYWVPAAALAGIDLSAIPDYAEGSTP